jgi:hypothetical protein
VDSVRAQTYANIEVIAHDDDSTDGASLLGALRRRALLHAGRTSRREKRAPIHQPCVWTNPNVDDRANAGGCASPEQRLELRITNSRRISVTMTGTASTAAG